MTGRKDCISDDPEGRGYVTYKAEVTCHIINNKSEANNFFTEPAKTI